MIQFLLSQFESAQSKEALVFNGRSFLYSELLQSFQDARAAIAKIPAGATVSLEADFSPVAAAMLLALIERRTIVAPLTTTLESRKNESGEIAQIEYRVQIDSSGLMHTEATGRRADHAHFQTLRRQQHPGLVLFSSGSTGKSKGVVHDFVPLLEKYKRSSVGKRMVGFLLFDHIGGINTLLHSLAHQGCLILLSDRSSHAVTAAIEQHRVQVLPTSPTFLNLLVLSEAWKGRDLSSLEVITYGTEPMSESRLKELAALFPAIRFQQTYGLSELGIMHSRSKSSDSLWMQVGGEGFQTRVVNGLLEIKSPSAMLGYLNAPSPFTEDGWFRTGDAVEVDGEWLRVLGRQSEMINVGGEKVYPAEIEDVLMTMDGVEQVVVSGEPHPLMGQIVNATVKITTGESLVDFRKRMRLFCKDKLSSFKTPQKVVLAHDVLHNERFKVIRKTIPSAS